MFRPCRGWVLPVGDGRVRTTRPSGTSIAEAFDGQTYRSDWALPTNRLDDARTLMASFTSELTEPPFGPPTKRYPHTADLDPAPPNNPDINSNSAAATCPSSRRSGRCRTSAR
jgi:hypothetical protein